MLLPIFKGSDDTASLTCPFFVQYLPRCKYVRRAVEPMPGISWLNTLDKKPCKKLKNHQKNEVIINTRDICIVASILIIIFLVGL